MYLIRPDGFVSGILTDIPVGLELLTDAAPIFYHAKQ